ncbi:MAG: YCF48-related protein [Crocinitomicaceae bacterium]
MFQKILIIVAFMMSSVISVGQWIESGVNNNNPWEVVFGVSVPQSNVIWGIIEHQNWSPLMTKYIRSVDGGVTWTSGDIDTLSTFACIKIRALSDSIAFASTLTWPLEDSSRIYRTEDGGTTWQFIPSAVNGLNETCIDFHFFDQNNGMTYGAKINGPMTIYTTNNGGVNWTSVPANNLPTALTNEGMLITGGNGTHGAAGSELWFGTTKGRIFHTNDNGYTWNATILDTLATIHGVAFKDNLNGVAISSYTALANNLTSNRTWITSDGGVTWTEQTGIINSPKFGMLQYLPGSENTYISTYAGPGPLGTLITQDGGLTWNVLDNKIIYGADFISEFEGWGGGRMVANDKGLYKWTGTELSVQDYRNNELITSPTLASTHITLNTDNMNIESVMVYNMNGQGMKLPMDGNTIDISRLGTGTYLVVLKDNDKTLKRGLFVKL